MACGFENSHGKGVQRAVAQPVSPQAVDKSDFLKYILEVGIDAAMDRSRFPCVRFSGLSYVRCCHMGAAEGVANDT